MSKRRHPGKGANKGKSAGGTPPAAPQPGRRALLSILRAICIFVVCLIVFYAFEATTLFHGQLFPAYLRVNASVSASILGWLGQEAVADGTMLGSGSFAMEIRRGCDAVEPSVLYIAAVLALPVFVWMRAVGILIGTAILMAVNLLRILTLFYVGTYWPGAFEAMHLDVWQAIFILLVIVLWVFWARWAKSRGGMQRYVAA